MVQDSARSFSQPPLQRRTATLDAGALRRIAAGARTLDELLRDAEGWPTPAGGIDTETIARLQQWAAAFGAKDPAAFAHRLAWDGLDPTRAGALLSPQGLAVPLTALPAWTAWLDDISRECLTAVPAHATHAVASDQGVGTPFAECLSPVVRAGHTALTARLAERQLTLPQGLWPTLDQQLLREVTGAAELAFHERFTSFCAAAEDTSPVADVYRRFCQDALADGLVSVFEEFPVLARHVAIILEAHVQRFTELWTRLSSDRAALAATLADGRSLGEVIAIDPALSDPHDGRRRVVGLTFASGVRVVYKPRDLTSDAALATLMHWLQGRGVVELPPVPRVLAREEYGWVQFVEPQEMSSAAEVSSYFQRAGGLLCLMHLLRGSDLHMENLVATRDGPVLVDLETLLQPGTHTAPAADADQDGPLAVNPSTGSCLTSGLLTWVETGPEGELFDVGGLRGRGRGQAAITERVWHDVGTPQMGHRMRPGFTLRETNSVRFNDAAHDPADHAPSLLAGFASTYRALVSARHALAAADGPLEAFSSAETRLLTRPTSQYGGLLYVLASPRYQRRGTDRSAAIDVLFRGMAGSSQQPAGWPLARQERLALEHYDVPRFTMVASSRALRAGGREIAAPPLSQSGFAALHTRLQAFSETDLTTQLRLLEGALTSSPTSSYCRPLFPDAATASAPPAERLLACAEWIADEVIARTTKRYASPASLHGALDGLRPHALYDGTLGPTLLCAALGRTTGGARFTAAAHARLESICADLDAAVSSPHPAIGFGDGTAGVLYGLTLASWLLADDARVRPAIERALRMLAAAPLEADQQLDLLGGAAGVILAVLAIPDASPVRLDIARRCGDRLLATEQQEGGLWIGSSGHTFLGFGHGTAGIGLALARAAAATGDSRYAAAAGRAYDRLLATVNAGRGNWPTVAPSSAGTVDGHTMNAWCHGTPGIVLAFAAAADDVCKAAWAPVVESALSALERVPAHLAEHACCGTAGRAEALTTAARTWSRPTADQAARRLGEGMLARANRRGHLRLTAVPYDYKTFHPGFFRGVSGVGYTLLRLAGHQLPNVLCVDTLPLSFGAASGNGVRAAGTAAAGANA